MTWQIRIAHADISFPCAADETVLDAAERAGFALPYSCRKGVCNTCEGDLVAGQVRVAGRGVVQGKAAGVLLCQARPRSDLEIGPQRIERREPLARKTLKASVIRLTRPIADVAILNLRFPIGVRAKFRAGQYAQIFLPAGDRRNFSMANPPQANDGLELHIRHVPGGRFSEQVLATLKVGDKLDLELPYGDFFLRDGLQSPIILVATGTGFAPIKSIVEDALKRGNQRPMKLYWGARKHEDLYLADLPQKWSERAPWFSFVPVLSEPDGAWPGRAGLVHQAVMADHPNLSSVEVYACGNPLMIAAARYGFIHECGLPEQRFYSDAFVQSGAAEDGPQAKVAAPQAG
jgi:NAD(P)H-flavin reductase/ferredoxin